MLKHEDLIEIPRFNEMSCVLSFMKLNFLNLAVISWEIKDNCLYLFRFSNEECAKPI